MTSARSFLVVVLSAALASACAMPSTRARTPAARRQQPVPGPAVAPAPQPAAEATVSPAPSPPAGQPPFVAQPGGETPPTPSGPGPPAAGPASPAARSGRQIVLNFDNADIEAVIQAASEIMGFNYTLGPGVQGKKVTVQTSGRIPEEEVFNVLLAVLEVHGVTAIRSGNLYKIVPITAARERPVPTVIGGQPDPTRRDDEIITQIVPIAHVPSDRIAAAVRPFVQGGNVVVQGNLLIITDTAANIARLLQIVGVLDVEATLDELRIILVRYADAVELAKILNDFFAGRRVRTAPTTPSTPVVPTPPLPAPARPTTPTTTVPGADGADRPPLILADKRTNSLIISARRNDLEIATKLLGQLDVDTQANKRVFVYYVENAKAKELAATLTEIFGKAGEKADQPPRRETLVGAPPPGLAPPPAPAPPTTPAPPGAAPAGVDLEPGVVEGQVKVIADEPNNALIITTFPRNWPLIEDTIRKLDRTPKQVLIEVLVAEITLDDENRLGLEWTLRTQQNVRVGGQSYNVGTVTRLDAGPPSSLPGQTPAPTLPGLPVLLPATAGLTFFLFETDRFLGLLNLYANYGRLNVLSSPHILTSENKKAVINVSDSVPIVTTQVSSQTGVASTQAQQAPTNVLTQNVEYRDAGIILTVTPRISDKRVVALDVKQTVNNVGAPQPPSGSPIIIKREAETSVVLRDNQTLVLGGLIQTRREHVNTGIPGLSKIPLLGFLFGVERDRVQRTELLILITPRVIGDPSEAKDLYEQIVNQRPGLQKGLRAHPSLITPETQEAFPPSQPAPAPPPPGPPAGGAPSER